VRYLLDTCVILSALRSRRGASHLVVQQALLGQVPTVMHFKLLAQYWDVLTRPEPLRHLIYTPTQIERLLAALVGVAEEVTVRFLWRPNLPDEGDNFIIEIAVAAQPCTIVTHNVQDFYTGELKFPTVDVKRPQEIIRRGKL
jgi:predicted nucleic acid-binding protein